MMSAPQRTESTDSTADATRKRVCKACDRCRLKKSKCDGSHPCTRCKADNAICVFGERKKSHDKVYPKGYVEMLEQQQEQLVTALQEMYRRSLAGQRWPGPALVEANGHPLTHDILARLDLLEVRHGGGGDLDTFEEDCQKLQAKLLTNGSGFAHRRDSASSESEQSQQDPVRPSPQNTPHHTPTLGKYPAFNKDFTFSTSSSPTTQSPAPRTKMSLPRSPLHPSPPFTNDPHLYQPEWSNPEAILRSKYAMQAPQLQTSMSMGHGQWDISEEPYDMDMDYTYAPPLANSFVNLQSMQAVPDFGATSLESMDFDFAKFIQVGP